MSKRQSLLIAICLVLTALSLVVPSFPGKLILAVLLLVAAAVWAVTLLNKGEHANTAGTSRERLDQTGSPESFALSSLLEATMSGMREGLLVVNKDMRVVASNPAAHKLFNPSVAALQSQRLTELTRNPAIYSAFLDGLKGIERSGVKVETHGPERQVFDLRVVPIGNANGNGAEGALGVFFDITRTERLEIVRQEFLSNVSHELRTPLTAIIAFVETLETGAMEDPESCAALSFHHSQECFAHARTDRRHPGTHGDRRRQRAAPSGAGRAAHAGPRCLRLTGGESDGPERHSEKQRRSST